MSSGPWLLVRVDADEQSGLGHAVRTAALVDALGADALVVGSGAGLAGLFPRAERVPGGDDALREQLANEDFDAAVIDLPAHAETAARRVREAGSRAIVIDDFGGSLAGDLIVNGTGPPSQHVYAGLPRGARVLCGTRYALLRPGFAAVSAARERRGLAIAAGSGPSAESWVSDLLDQDLARFAPVTLVVGRGFGDADPLRERCVAAGVCLHRGLEADALAELLRSSALALVTAGMLLYECLAAATPTVVYPHVERTVAECAWLAAQGCAIDLGRERGADPAAALGALASLQASPERARALGTRATREIDGRGVERVAAAARSLLASPRAELRT